MILDPKYLLKFIKRFLKLKDIILRVFELEFNAFREFDIDFFFYVAIQKRRFNIHLFNFLIIYYYYRK